MHGACCKMAMGIVFVLVAIFANAQEKIDFDKYFEDKTVGLEYLRVGCKDWDTLQLLERGFWMKHSVWAGSKTNLVDPFNNGHYSVELRDPQTGKVLYSRGFNSLFQEYWILRKDIPRWASTRRWCCSPSPR